MECNTCFNTNKFTYNTKSSAQQSLFPDLYIQQAFPAHFNQWKREQKTLFIIYHLYLEKALKIIINFSFNHYG